MMMPISIKKWPGILLKFDIKFGQEILTRKAIIMCNPRTQKKKQSLATVFPNDLGEAMQQTVS